MRYLILSDIHSNWEALQAVLEEADRDGYDRIVCCGDLVGYGADPNAVTDWARQSHAATIRGNHDKACVGLVDLEWFNPAAQKSTMWTQSVLSEENHEYLARLPMGPMALGGFEVVHGSPGDEDEYVVSASEAAMCESSLMSPVTFFGHTHIQGGFQFIQRAVIGMGATPAKQDRLETRLQDDAWYLVNPGSVGQPRDHDSRAAWALFIPEDRLLVYRRCKYDVETAAKKIVAAKLPDILARRLSQGR